MSASLRLSIVVPTFNESGNVREVLTRVDAALGSDGWEIVFVDDDSPDGTASVVRSLAASDSRVRCIQRIGRRGLSSACIEGMLASAAPCIAVMDADLQHDERILPRMLQLLENDEADVAVGSRYTAGGSTGDWDQGRAALSQFAAAVSRVILAQRVSDPMSGFFMIRRELLDGSARRLSGIGFKILLDLLASASAPLRIVEVPFTFRRRFSGESKLDEMAVWEYGMLLADKSVGRFVPARFLVFALVGGLGILVHMTVLALLLNGVGNGFTLAQSAATAVRWCSISPSTTS